MALWHWIFSNLLIWLLITDVASYVNIPEAFYYHVNNKFVASISLAKNITHGCRQTCSMTSESLNDCWMPTLAFYERILVGLMKQYVSIQANRAIWNNYHGQETDYTLMLKETVKRLNDHPKPLIEDSNGVFSRKDLHEIFSSLVHNSRTQAEAIIERHAKPPHEVNCPLACERHWDMYKWLFIVSSGFTIALAIFIISSVCILEHYDKRLTKLEALEFGNNVAPLRGSLSESSPIKEYQTNFERKISETSVVPTTS